ncbi:MAG: HAD-IIIC family phosphatase [Hyphomicrobiaceae bacterium]|nr:HAD-IIIC family phosphatase [Hyphomicrobiaceae bacterium]
MPALSPGRLVDAVIAAAPECLQQGILLQGIDWARVPPGRVNAMLGDLGSRNVRLPGWLARALVVGGHVLPADAAGRLSAELQALNQLNGCSGSADERRMLASVHRRLCLLEERDADVLAAAVARLHALGWAEEEAELGLVCWDAAPRVLTSAAAALTAHRLTLPAARIRLAGFSTTHTLAQDLGPAFAACGWQAQVGEAGFGDGLAELLAPAGDADCLVLLMDIEGFAARDWRRLPDEGLELVRERADLLAAALAAYPERAQCPLLINTIPSAPAPTAGLLDRQHALGLRRAIDIVNQRVLEAAARSGQVHVCDADLALAHVPLARQTDPKMWFYGRLAYSAAATRALARSFAQAWQTLKRGPLKVLALDFDNTLWGGIYGDDGLEALACGTDFPGNAFSAFQQECLRLKGQGMLLAGLSKNDPDAISVFERHPGMVLRAEDFTAVAIDWEPKPGNIRRLAAELDLGLESFLFLDDSPHEREAMRQMCPAVTVPEMPADPALRPLWIRGLTATWPLRLTDEDGRRADMYRAERAARSLKEGAASLADYLAALQQRLVVEPVRRETVPRAAQMHQRTNQFNLTTVRLGEAELGAMLDERSGSLALIGRVTDRFGDHGIVIAATARIDGDAAEIATFLMSCRVIGREIETAFLGALLVELEKRGVRRVMGAYVPTPKNGQVRELYPSAGFRQASADAERTIWNWTIGEAEPPRSAFVTVEWGS